MLVVQGATAHPTIIFLRCRPKAQAIKTYPTSRNLNPRIESPSYYIIIRLSWLKRRVKKRKDPKGTSGNVLGIRKNSL